ncbi:MAG TPA: hypothetical protein VE398_25280 [Acidobacteriota bacterium]|nr:hypothetical protein [Acidobacteriota bacterium]
MSPVATPALTSSPNRVSISDDSLRNMGISRSDFVDRLAGSLFLGRNVDLLITISRSMGSRAALGRGLDDAAENAAAAEGVLLSVEERRQYRIPRARVLAADVDALDQLAITDGVTYIEIAFTKVESVASLR